MEHFALLQLSQSGKSEQKALNRRVSKWVNSWLAKNLGNSCGLLFVFKLQKANLQKQC